MVHIFTMKIMFFGPREEWGAGADLNTFLNIFEYDFTHDLSYGRAGFG